MFSIVYYTNNKIDSKIQNLCLSTLIGLTNQFNAQLVVVSWKPMPVEFNIVWSTHKACHESIYKQIQAGLIKSKYNRIYLAEHDVLYPKSHFDLEATDITYNSNLWHLTREGFFEGAPVNFLSACLGSKQNLLKAVDSKLEELKTTGNVVWTEFEGIRKKGKDPILDIRHTNNFTGSRSSIEYQQDIAYWGSTKRFTELWQDN